MKAGLLVVVCAVLLGGCMKPQIEYVINGDRRLMVESDANWFSPSFTRPTRERCVFQPEAPDIETYTMIDGSTHTCKGVYVAETETPTGFQNGVGGVIGESVTGLGAAAFIGPGGFAKMGSKTTNKTTNSASGESSGGNSTSYTQSDIDVNNSSGSMPNHRR